MAAETVWYTPILVALFDNLANVVIPVIAALIVKKLWPAISATASRAGLELEAREEAKLRYIVEKWVRIAEETVEAKYKGSAEKIAGKGSEKLKTAMVGILTDVPGIDPSKAESMVTSVLTQVGMGAASGIKLVASQLEKKQ